MSQHIDPKISLDALKQAIEQLGEISQPTRVFSEQEQEALYALGYRHYQMRQHLDALKMFWLLINQDISNAKYYKAAGSCLMMLKQYKEAIIAFGIATTLNVDDATSLFYMGQCCLTENRHEQAQTVFEIFLEETQDKPQHTTMRQRAQHLVSTLQTRQFAS